MAFLAPFSSSEADPGGAEAAAPRMSIVRLRCPGVLPGDSPHPPPDVVHVCPDVPKVLFLWNKRTDLGSELYIKILNQIYKVL